MNVLMLNGDEVRGLLEPEGLLEALGEAFRALSGGLVVAPRRGEVDAAGAGFLLSMPAYQPGREIGVKLVSVFHDNVKLGLPAHQALICLFDAQTGMPVCIMDGTYVTALRTAGAAALSARLLARADTQVLSIIGAGVQGSAHLKMLLSVREFAEVRIASRNLEHAEQLAAMDARAHAVGTVEEAVRGADVVCLCTNSGEKVISSDWLEPGMHVTSVGYRPPGGELDPKVVEVGRLFVETRLAFEPPPAGCGELAGMDPSIGTELGEVLSGVRPGRGSESEVTIYKAMGHACEDLAAASLVYRRAQEEGVGQVVEL